MKLNLLGLVVFIFVLIFTSLGIWYVSFSLVPIKFNSKHPRIETAKSESLLLNLYVSYFLDVGKSEFLVEDIDKAVKTVRPRVIGVVFTDKQRMGSPVIFDKEPVIGLTLDSNTLNELLVYIWVSDKVLEKEDANRTILNYIVNNLSYRQKQKGSLHKILLNLVKTPFYVKTS